MLKRKPGAMIGTANYSTLRKRPPSQGKIAKLGWFSKSRRSTMKHKGR